MFKSKEKKKAERERKHMKRQQKAEIRYRKKSNDESASPPSFPLPSIPQETSHFSTAITSRTPTSPPPDLAPRNRSKSEGNALHPLVLEKKCEEENDTKKPKKHLFTRFTRKKGRKNSEKMTPLLSPEEKKKRRDTLRLLLTQRPDREALVQSGVLFRAVPLRKEVMFLLIEYLEKKALHLEGVFRKSGDSVVVDQLYRSFEGDLEQLRETLEGMIDPHNVTGALKLYLREQTTEPLIPLPVFYPLLKAQEMEDEQEKINVVRGKLRALAPDNFEVLLR